MNLEYGVRGLTLNAPATAPELFQNQYAGVTLDIYFTKKFGAEGTYRRLLLAQSTLNRTLEGEQEQAGLFFEIGVLRLFANWRHEFSLYNAIGIPSSSEFRDGYGGGLKFYF